MKRFLGWTIASVISLGMSGFAVAADLPVKAPPPVAPVSTWTGFYVGLNAGGAWNDTRDDVYPTGCFLDPVCSGQPLTNNALRTDSVNLNGAGFTGGGQAGFNWQRDRWVFGVEGDINYVGINDGSSIARPLTAPLAGTFVHVESDKPSWLATIRGRIGVIATPNFLLYGTGGVAFGGVRSATSVSFTTTPDVYSGSTDTTRVGWTAGGGGEWMFAPQWSVKAEYLYVDLGTAGYANACISAACAGFVNPPTYQTDLRVHEHIARVGVNYHFGGPVFAKY